MKFDEINNPEYLQRMYKGIGATAFTAFIEMALLVDEDEKKLIEEEKSTRLKIDMLLGEIHKDITTKGIPCDKEQLNAFLLKQLDDKYPPSTGVQQQNKKVKQKSKQPPKYTYKDAKDKVRTWTGKGRVPKELEAQASELYDRNIDFKGLKGKEKDDLLEPFLINKPTQQQN